VETPILYIIQSLICMIQKDRGDYF
jgi:hypothetical protein